LFTNSSLPCVDGVQIEAELRRLNVLVIDLPITYRLPRGFVNSWGNQFYIFDIIRYAAREFGDERIFVFDSDCIFIRPIDEMEAAIDSHGTLTYTLYLDEPADHVVNGLSRRDLATIANKVFGLRTDFVHYSGGEIFASSAAECRAIEPLILALWDETIKDSEGLFVHEEAHALSILYRVRGYTDSTANAYIKRIWTLLRKRTALREDLDLIVWHLPSEKKMGFVKLFRDCVDPGSGFSSSSPSELLCYYRRVMGVPHRGLLKFTRDCSSKIWDLCSSSLA
jgi:hypothetical protein